MAELKRSDGKTVIVDDDVAERFANHCLTVSRRGITRVTLSGKSKLLHRVVMGEPKQELRFINRNDLDCRRSNLTAMDFSEQRFNRRGPNANNKLGIRNVTYQENAKKYVATFRFRGHRYYMGFFHDPITAGLKAAAKRLEVGEMLTVITEKGS